MANAVGLLETWMNSTVGRIESTTNTFTLVTDEVDTLKTVLVRIFVCMPPELFFFKKKKSVWAAAVVEAVAG